ncbi:MAG: hypothetical protein AAB074_23255 [Planctomycetota bacterium]
MSTSPPPEPLAAAPSAAPKKARTCLLQLLFIAGVITIGVKCSTAARDRERRFLAEVRAEHGGRIAWIAEDKEEVRWVELAESSSSSAVKRHVPGGKPVRVAWSSSGEKLFVVVQTGTLDHIHRIDVVDRATGVARTILDLGTQNLEENNLDVDEFWVAPFGDAEAEVDRVYFQLEEGVWYSVEANRPRVRPEAGAPARQWDQSACPDGRHKVKRKSDDDDSWLEITDGDRHVKFTTDDVRGQGAWWCPPK